MLEIKFDKECLDVIEKWSKKYGKSVDEIQKELKNLIEYSVQIKGAQMLALLLKFGLKDIRDLVITKNEYSSECDNIGEEGYYNHALKIFINFTFTTKVYVDYYTNELGTRVNIECRHLNFEIFGSFPIAIVGLSVARIISKRLSFLRIANNTFKETYFITWFPEYEGTHHIIPYPVIACVKYIGPRSPKELIEDFLKSVSLLL